MTVLSVRADVGRSARSGSVPGAESAVATGCGAATETAVAILRSGGNAVDAAVAAAFVLGVCEPSGSGLGGQASMLVASPGGPPAAIDGQSFAPEAVTRRAVSRKQQRVGLAACTVPSMVAVLGRAHRGWGALSWAAVLEPAIALATEGYQVTALGRRQLSWVAASLARDPVASQVFLPGGRVPALGQSLKQPALARTLARLADAGADDFYNGHLARVMEAEMQSCGGLLTADDLAAAATSEVLAPLVASSRGWTLATVPGRGGGVPLLLAMQVMQELEAVSARDGIPAALLAAAVSRAAQTLRDDLAVSQWPWSGGPAPELVAAAVSRTYRDLERWRAETPLPNRATSREEPGDTTHVSISDGTGLTVALTSSIQSLYGAKVASSELGFVWNNYLRTCPRRPSPYRLGSGSRPRSNAAPTIVIDPAGVPIVAVGAAGSRRITSSLVNVLTSVLQRKSSLHEAIHSPRMHATVRELWVEKPLVAELPASAGPVRVRRRHDYAMGAVHAVQRYPDGSASAVADPRREGTARAGSFAVTPDPWGAR